MNTTTKNLQSVFDGVFVRMMQVRQASKPRLALRETGAITSIASGIAKVSGLPGVGFEEVLKFPGESYGIAFNIDADEIGVILLDDYSQLNTGDEVERRGHVMDVPVSDGLIGRVIDPLGRPLDGKAPVISVEAPAHRTRRSIHHGPRTRHRAFANRHQGHRCTHSRSAAASAS